MTFTVGNIGDATGGDCATPTNTDCTLRQAILDANPNAGADTIVFASGLTGTITLGSDLPTITDPVTIQGPGASVIEVSGNDAHRIFDLRPATGGDPVSISGLTLSHGKSDSSTTQSEEGGAILNETADLTLSDSILTGNNAISLGGAIYSGCDCGGPNGSGYAAGLTMTNSTLSGNTVVNATGGAVYLNYGSATIANSTFVGNSAHYGGGLGIFDMVDPVLIENSTFTGNSANGNGNGGGIRVFENPSGVTISGSTIVGNSGDLEGGGVFFVNLPGGPLGPNVSPVLHNTIVAGNTATTAGSDLGSHFSGAFDAAFSLFGTSSGASINETVAGSNLVGVNPMLAPLASNGGTTMTMVPLTNSPVIDKGSSFGLGTDQRGLTRPVDLPNYKNSAAAGGDGSDIGAVELQSNPGGGDENAFTVSSPRRNKKNGTATVTVTLPDPGTLTLGGKGVGAATAQSSRARSSASTVTLTIRAVGKAKKKLRQKGKVKVTPSITFTPTAFAPSTQSLAVTLKKKPKK
jgi:hypothetical protein